MECIPAQGLAHLSNSWRTSDESISSTATHAAVILQLPELRMRVASICLSRLTKRQMSCSCPPTPPVPLNLYFPFLFPRSSFTTQPSHSLTTQRKQRCAPERSSQGEGAKADSHCFTKRNGETTQSKLAAYAAYSMLRKGSLIENELGLHKRALKPVLDTASKVGLSSKVEVAS
eukprot:404058-Pelagomonas_calceolata.AAC.5